MSLKSKLEAVIYAAEEPVTLAQLTALFAEEALAWQAEQQASVAAQAAETLPLEGPGSEADAWNPPAEEPEAAAEPEPAPEREPSGEPQPEPAPEPPTETEAGVGSSPET